MLEKIRNTGVIKNKNKLKIMGKPGNKNQSSISNIYGKIPGANDISKDRFTNPEIEGLGSPYAQTIIHPTVPVTTATDKNIKSNIQPGDPRGTGPAPDFSDLSKEEQKEASSPNSEIHPGGLEKLKEKSNWDKIKDFGENVYEKTIGKVDTKEEISTLWNKHKNFLTSPAGGKSKDGWTYPIGNIVGTGGWQSRHKGDSTQTKNLWSNRGWQNPDGSYAKPKPNKK
jgi:hypothetical protein